MRARVAVTLREGHASAAARDREVANSYGHASVGVHNCAEGFAVRPVERGLAMTRDGQVLADFCCAVAGALHAERVAAVAHLSGKGDRFVNIDDFKGLARKQPLAAAMFTIFLLSLIGVPLTGGFFGKFYIFKAALQSNLVWLSVISLLNSAVASSANSGLLVNRPRSV